MPRAHPQPQQKQNKLDNQQQREDESIKTKDVVGYEATMIDHSSMAEWQK